MVKFFGKASYELRSVVRDYVLWKTVELSDLMQEKPVTIMCVGMKCAHFSTESTTVITASCLEERRSSTVKSTLSVERVQKEIVHWDKQNNDVPTSNCVIKVQGEIIKVEGL